MAIVQPEPLLPPVITEEFSSAVVHDLIQHGFCKLRVPELEQPALVTQLAVRGAFHVSCFWGVVSDVGHFGLVAWHVTAQAADRLYQRQTPGWVVHRKSFANNNSTNIVKGPGHSWNPGLFVDVSWNGGQ